MNAGSMLWRGRTGLVIGLVVVFGVSFFGCSLMGGTTRPSWTDGVSPDYPAEQYLTGVGQGENRTVAEDNAYAALARIFKAQVSAQSKDWESYLLVERRGKTEDEHRLVLDKVTRVSTDKVLENVKIVDRWFDQEAGLHYALAAMRRSQAEAALRERMAELDHAVESDIEEARRTVDKLAKVRGLRRAARDLVFREALNADLRVIRPSGHGEPAAYRVQDITRELEDFLSKNLAVEVVVTGEHVDPIEQALAEGLIQEGLRVVSSPSGSAEARTHERGIRFTADLLVRGTVHVWPVDIRDPHFVYVRWCSEFEVMDVAGQRVVGAVSRGGKEGHLSEREATAKVLRVMQRDMAAHVSKAIAAHVYGESELPAEPVRPAGCPREGSGAQPATATH